MVENVTIIGAGPAGIAAAIQLGRCGIEPVIFEREKVGGLLRNANIIENYPGFPDGIAGRELIKLMEKHLGNSKKLFFEEIIKIDYDDGLFTLKSESRIIQSRIVMVASGTIPIDYSEIKIPDEISDRVMYEIYSILGVREKTIAIVGAGDAAFDYALNLGENNEVVILNRGSRVRCLPVLNDRTKGSDNIKYMENAKVLSISNGSDDKIAIHYLCNCKNRVLRAHYLVFAIGRKPATGFFSDRMTEEISRFKHDGKIHMIGDVRNGDFRQAAIAAGDGIKAAMKVAAKLREIP